MSTDKKKIVAADIIAAMGSGDVEAILERVTDDVRWWIAGDLPISGELDKSGVARMIGGMSGVAAGPVTFTMRSIVAEGNRVAIEAASEADLKNGKHYRNEYYILFEFSGDLVASVREYMDTKKVNDIMFG